jgi:hypothetical protein
VYNFTVLPNLLGQRVIDASGGHRHSMILINNLCFGRTQHDPMVCSSHGNCSSNEKCACQEGWYGSNCNITNCNGIPSIDRSVCSGNGSCVARDECTCFRGWGGKFCSLLMCNDHAWNHSSSCINGNCVGPDNCSCHPGFVGSSCEQWHCHGLLSNHSDVCGKIGKCVQPNICLCVKWLETWRVGSSRLGEPCGWSLIQPLLMFYLVYVSVTILVAFLNIWDVRLCFRWIKSTYSLSLIRKAHWKKNQSEQELQIQESEKIGLLTGSETKK